MILEAQAGMRAQLWLEGRPGGGLDVGEVGVVALGCVSYLLFAHPMFSRNWSDNPAQCGIMNSLDDVMVVYCVYIMARVCTFGNITYLAP